MASAFASNGTNGATPKDSWAAAPGPAAFDLRSDVHTNPTASMLAAIQSTSLLDDVWQEDTTTNDLEAYVASLTGHEAALLVLSGTMGNQVALRTHLQTPPHSIICDYRAHILKYEAGGAASTSGALIDGVKPSNGHHLTLRDVKKHAVLSDDVHECPTRIVALENTIAGAIVPLEDCRAISQWARARGIIMHLDGARLWETVAAGGGTLRDYSACFDSISLCFSKGLGAPIGSILVGSAAFIKRARWVRKMLGGGLRQSGVIAAPARVAVEETFLGGKLQASHQMARRVEAMWLAKGGRTTQPVETNMVWLDLAGYGLDEASHEDEDEDDEDADADETSEKDAKVTAKANFNGSGLPEKLERTDTTSLAAKHGLRATNLGRFVIHYQIGEETLRRLDAFMQELVQRRTAILASSSSSLSSSSFSAAAAAAAAQPKENTAVTAAAAAVASPQQHQQQNGVHEALPQPDSSMG